MPFLKLYLPGTFLDAQLYRGHLYLLTEDNRLRILNWDELISRTFPGPGGQPDPLAQLVLRENSLAHTDRRLLDWVVYDPFKNELSTRLNSFRERELAPIAEEFYEFDLGNSRFHTFEMYYSHAWFAGEDSAGYLQAGPGYRRGRHSRLYPIFNGRAFSLSLNRRLLWLLSPNGTFVSKIGGIASDRVSVDMSALQLLGVEATNVGWHWGDVVLTNEGTHQSRVWAEHWHKPNTSERLKSIHEARERIISELDTGHGFDVDPRFSYREIALDVASRHRLFCSRERAVGISAENDVAAFEWDYGLQVAENGLANFTAHIDEAERVLISTFGWIVESPMRVQLVSRLGVNTVFDGEAVQVRTFPETHWYENIALVIDDSVLHIIAVLDYDFLLPQDRRTPQLGRRSEIFSELHRALRRHERPFNSDLGER